MVKVYLFPSMFFLPSLMKNKYVKKGRESEPSFKFLHIKTYTNAGISIKLMFSELNKVEFGGRWWWVWSVVALHSLTLFLVVVSLVGFPIVPLLLVLIEKPVYSLQHHRIAVFLFQSSNPSKVTECTTWSLAPPFPNVLLHIFFNKKKIKKVANKNMNFSVFFNVCSLCYKKILLC